jgi:hypothetical protein
MVPEPVEYEITRETAVKLPNGPRVGIFCPCCNTPQGLDRLLKRGSCMECGSEVTVTLSADCL